MKVFFYLWENFTINTLVFHYLIGQPPNSGNAPIGTNLTPPGTPQWGKEFKKQSLFYHNRSLTLVSQKATLPYKNNYLDLDPIYKDENGDQLIRITWDYSDNDREIHAFIQEKQVEIMEKLGATHLLPVLMAEHYAGGLAYQYNGSGVIMGSEHNTSAVNNYLQMWDMENLFVCGASAFPHFGVTNPTTTAAALIYRATEGMIKYLKDGGGLLVEARLNKN